jgi:hypothetical protein
MKQLMQMIAGLHASAAQSLPFAPPLDMRPFSVRHEGSGLLIYSVAELDSNAPAAFPWENEGHRCLFAGDSICLDEGEWIATVLGSATGGRPCSAMTNAADARRRTDAIAERMPRGEDG